MKHVLSFVVVVVVPLLALACGSGDDSSSSSGSTSGAAETCAPTPPAEQLGGACNASIERPPLVSVRHVPENTPIEYCSNPPSSGRHYAVWAAFQEFQQPVPMPYLVHSMEHGAIVLFYKCEAACPEIVDALRQVRDRAAPDPACADNGKRIIIVPNPAQEVPVVAAAWGALYKATCVDAPTIDKFVADHYAKGPEDFCVAGRTF